jgi:hypothetical protein
MRQLVGAAAADNARDSWDGSLTEFSPPSIPVAITTGCAPMLASVPARTAMRIGRASWSALLSPGRAWRVSPRVVLVAGSGKLTGGSDD